MVVAGAIMWAVKSDGPGFAALERLIHQRVLASAVVNADETEVRMLKPGHGKAITGYLSGYAGDADHRYVFYDFRPSRSETARQRCWQTIVVTYKPMATCLHLAGTHSAGRLVDVGMLGAWSEGLRGSASGDQPPAGPRSHDLDTQLYDLEDRAKEMSADDRRALRQAEAFANLGEDESPFR